MKKLWRILGYSAQKHDRIIWKSVIEADNHDEAMKKAINLYGSDYVIDAVFHRAIEE